MFFLACHFAEGSCVAVRQKHRIVAETLVAAWWPNDRAVDAAFEFLRVPVWPRNTKRGNKMCLALRRCGGAECVEFLFDDFHGAVEILVGAGPARGINAGLATECIDRQAGIVGQSRQAGGSCRGFSLDARIVAKRLSGFFRLRKFEFRSRYSLDGIMRQHFTKLSDFAAIMAGNRQTPGD